VAATRKNLGWSAPPFELPASIVTAWRKAAARGAARNRQWQARLARSPQATKFRAAIAGEIPAAVFEGLAAFRAEHAAKGTKVATRKASEMALSVINAKAELTVGGSADLTHSNLTLTAGMGVVGPGSYAGRYIHYGVREHAMAAAMNGLALHGGFVPYGGTFLAFADYARGAIRLSALMKQRVIYVLTHDSIGLGEDGPTHQPVEHLAMLRATPNLDVYRPADIVETAECWELALRNRDRPSVLVLSRQNLPALPRSGTDENRSARGAYVVGGDPDAPRDLTILATGSEVEVALAAATLLEAKNGIAATVVSMPCWEHFERQPAEYRRRVLGTAPRVGVEAAARLGWDRWIGERGTFVGMTGFGASAPAADLFKHFGITGEAVAAAGTALVEQVRALA
jgi:transketolase